jgi:energy-coupling factor transporter transmembrane protein EcfT
MFALTAAAILLMGMLANIDIGIRHILPIFCFLALLAGIATVRLWKPLRPVIVILWAWLIVGSALAHPFYLADFNLLAGSQPERIVTDSDLDWGQDLHLATSWFLAHDVHEAWLAYRGPFPPQREKRMQYDKLPRGTESKGWVAISVRILWFEDARAKAENRPEPYAWLMRFHPVARAGSSILIYHLVDPDDSRN